MMTSFRLLLLLALVALTPLPVVANGDPEPAFVAVASGAVSGVYYPAAGAICKEVSRERARHGIRCAVEATDGSVANIAALRAGLSEAAIVQGDVLVEAARGRGDQSPFFEVRALMTIHQEVLAVAVRADSAVQRFEDLAGQPVHLGGAGSGQRATVAAMLNAAGLDAGLLNDARTAAPRTIPEDLCEGRVAAAFLVAGHPNGILERTALTCPIRFLPMAEVAGPLVAAQTAYELGEIPGGLYAGIPDPVPSFGLYAILVTTSDLPEEVAYEIARTSLSQLDAIRAQHPALEALDGADMVAPTYVPFHPGALRAYRELGLID